MKRCRFCAEQIQDDAVRCRFCNKDLVPSRLPRILGWTAAAIVALFMLVLLIGTAIQQNDPKEWSEAPIGSRGRLYSPNSREMPIYADIDAMLDGAKDAKANDDLSLAQIIQGHRVIFAPSGSVIEVTETGLAGARKIRLMDGREGWVSARMIAVFR